ncbi:MAG: cytochrome c3 family protein [Bryobacterales bacterium]|nr:cytochrome c3 family protein [Bryobacterales bacterium]
MKRTAILIAAAVLLPLTAFADDELKTDPVGYAPAQPIAYSHKTHLALGLKCNVCHAMKPTEAGEGFAMGFPKESFCMGCHTTIKKDSPEIAKLAKAAADKKAVEWVRVYRLMPIVWFNHAAHTQTAKIACAACHGEVAGMAVTTKARVLNMKDCMDCHAERGAPNGCDFCHAAQ